MKTKIAENLLVQKWQEENPEITFRMTPEECLLKIKETGWKVIFRNTVWVIAITINFVSALLFVAGHPLQQTLTGLLISVLFAFWANRMNPPKIGMATYQLGLRWKRIRKCLKQECLLEVDDPIKFCNLLQERLREYRDKVLRAEQREDFEAKKTAKARLRDLYSQASELSIKLPEYRDLFDEQKPLTVI